MSDMPKDYTISSPAPTPKPWASIVLGAGLVGALGFAGYQNSQLSGVRMQLSALERDMTTLRQAVASGDGSVTEKVAVLQQELEAARKESQESTAASRKAAETAAARQARLVAAQLNKRQEEQGKQIEAKLTEIKQSSDQATAD